MASSQRWVDTAYNKNFNEFILLTDTLIRKAHDMSATNTNEKNEQFIQKSINLYAVKVRNSLRGLDSIGSSLQMAGYFDKGKSTQSQDLYSPTAQLQCSYSHYMQNIRKSNGRAPAIVNAALTLEIHLKNGFPGSIYCPFIYDEVKFGPGLAPSKPIKKGDILPDSLRKDE